jgi:hypothetical protein
MRLVCGGMLGFAAAIVAGSIAVEAATGSVYMAPLALVPLMFTVGLAGLISPDVIRACGKYGGHLPRHYKVIGWGVIGLSFVLLILMMVGFFLAGFEPDRPGNL